MVLEFDHLDDADKSFNISNKPYASKEKLMAEIEKCRVLCANCHRRPAAPNNWDGINT